MTHTHMHGTSVYVSALLPPQDGGFQTALEYSDKRKMVFRISTGSSELEYVETMFDLKCDMH